MHPIEAEKQRQYYWWLKVFLPEEVRPGNRHERYQLGILLLAMLGFFISALIFAVQSLTLPMVWSGRFSAWLLVLLPLAVLLFIRWTGRYRQAALWFGLIGLPFGLLYFASLRTIYLGAFFWVPWLILFMSFLSGRRQGAAMALMMTLAAFGLLAINGAYGNGLGVFADFEQLLFHFLSHELLAILAITIMMYTWALYIDRMEAELESQHVLRAQVAHKAMIGEMLGNLAHEVNNPLAIVHTALIHYQRLLETRRLDASMQRGLVERMKDALDRLWAVVDDLDRASDWSDLEIPRSHASLQSDQDRPPQFGNSRLTDSSGKQNEERRRRLWIYPLMRSVISLLDRTLPRGTRDWTASQRFRARATALICTLGLGSSSINLLQQLFIERVSDQVLATGLVVFALAVLGMLALKLVPRPQLIGVGYVLLLFAAIVSLALTGGSVLMPALHWIPIMIASLFLVTRPRQALVVSFLLLGSYLVLMFELKTHGLQPAFGQTFPQYIQRMQSTVTLSSLTTLLLASSFISLMNSTYSQLVAEKDWHFLSARLREVNELADSAAILIGAPLKELLEHLNALAHDGQNPELLQRMLEAVNRINGVSQSFALLSRPRAHENVTVMDAKLWLSHVRNICLRRAAEAGWVLVTEVEPEDARIEGPLGHITMLVITCLKEALGHRAPQAQSPLHIRVRRSGEQAEISIQYAAAPRSLKPLPPQDELDEAMRLSLMQELLDLLAATLQRRQDGKGIILELRWRPADSGAQSLRP